MSSASLYAAPLTIISRKIAELRANPRNARIHPKRQIRELAESIRLYGFNNPILIGPDGEIIAGHGRLEAAKHAGLSEVPTIMLPHLNEQQRRGFVIADNKHGLNSSWDQEKLAMELTALVALDFDIPALGFSVTEVDFIIDTAATSATTGPDPSDDEVPDLEENAVSQMGDVWIMGRHRLINGDARSAGDYLALLADEQIDLIFTDPPYNVPIDGNVCGSGSVHHREFAMATGEMSPQQFEEFLYETLAASAAVCRDGAIAFVCMDWRHMGELIAAGGRVFDELKNVCVWNKKNAGMGTFYRSKHEMVFVFKKGRVAHVNTFGLGDGGRYRTNVWDYHGISSGGYNARQELRMHPTVKPVAMVADAIRDCSKRGDFILDAFAGSGTTLIAAHSTGRIARLIEFDSLYCDVIIRRYESLTGIQARLGEAGPTFDEISETRLANAYQS